MVLRNTYRAYDHCVCVTFSLVFQAERVKQIELEIYFKRSATWKNNWGMNNSTSINFSSIPERKYTNIIEYSM